ncbi:hypothetical protein NOL51_03320 [Vibrio parahaemolyticus]|uniref:hypothetical protein n=1 Tax=Vibrio parahaemolyticus TaxID=670 RepID=UPI00226A7EFA|nr:hypothetical protein [Vibrio parahaemolyticus]EHK0752621.1 hypothetical protein [Vibrio parahaemolyticus]MCX8932112.1 hypothetical protein [Vibrio parahaemolyticus]
MLDYDLRKPTIIEFVSFEDVAPLFGTRRAVYDHIRNGLLPTPLNPYGRRKMWPKPEIIDIQRAILLGYSKDQIKKLVIEITEKRKEVTEPLSEPQEQGAAQ